VELLIRYYTGGIVGIRSSIRKVITSVAPLSDKLLLLILQVTTYRGLPDGKLAILQSYIDEDVSSITISRCLQFFYISLRSLMLIRSDILSQNLQSFYTLSWASDLDGTPLLVAAGSNGIIRVINCGKEKLFKVQ
jgi:polycomb protein EED